MADEPGTDEFDNGADLFRRPDAYSFYQTIVFLRKMHAETLKGHETEEDFLRKRLRVNSYLSLAFPPNDVVGLRALPPSTDEPSPGEGRGEKAAPAGLPPTFARGERIEVTATFMGLYGSASPLPTFYTEELLDDYRRDLSAAKSFLDMVGQLFFIRYFQALCKYRLLDRIARENDGHIRSLLACLFGVGHEELLGGRELTDKDMACTGLFSLSRRPASGLRSYLAYKFDLLPEQVAIRQCVVGKTPVPAEQRAVLGEASVTLGMNCVLGSHVPDGMGTFRVELHSLDAATYHALLPGRPGWDELDWSIRFYAGTALRHEVKLFLRADDADVLRLGAFHGAELGGDAFLAGTSAADGDVAACGWTG